jgi:hypothetical protein
MLCMLASILPSTDQPKTPGRAEKKTIRAADAKEVGVGNPAEETYRYPNQIQRQS